MNQRYRLDEADKRVVKDRLREHLASRSEVRFAYLHGSFLGSHSFGDVDVAVSIDRDRVSTEPTTYELDLEAVLERGLGFSVDVRVVDGAPPSFRYAVTRGEALLVRDREAYATFRERTWNEYLDFAPLREEALRDLARHLRRD